MSLVGLNCLLVDKSTSCIQLAVLRASSQPLQRSSDLSKARVLLEYLEGGGGRREWTTLTNMDRYSAVFIEDQLVWARRVLPAESNNPVAWPAKAYSLLCGGLTLPQTTILVEYFCDQEKTYLQLSDTKQLSISEAKTTLSQHTQMIQELHDWEKKQRNREMLLSGMHNMTHHRVSVCSTHQHLSWIQGAVTNHNLQTKELTVVEDGRGLVHIVNPLMVDVQLMSLSNQQSMVSSTTSNWYAGQSPTNSPQLHHNYYGSSHQLAAPSSLSGINPALLHSEPNLHHGHSQYDGCMSGYNTPTGSYTNIHMASQSHLLSDHNSYLDEQCRHERSKSLGNIHLLANPPNARLAACKRRASHAVPLIHAPKRTRFADTLPSIPHEDDFFSSHRGGLSRSVSQPVLFKQQQTNKSQETEEDELDLIHSIISRETSLEGSPPDIQMIRSQSLSHIPRELGSLPSLHHASSLHVLHENYASNPDFSISLGSPPPYRQIPDSTLVSSSQTEQTFSRDKTFSLQEEELHVLQSLELPVAATRGQIGPSLRQPVHVASSPCMLSPLSNIGEEKPVDLDDDSEVNIDKIVNQHMGDDDDDITSLVMGNNNNTINSSINDSFGVSNKRNIFIGEKTRVGNREVVSTVSSGSKRGRGRPRLTEEEKQRRKELREMGLMKRSKRRTKEEVLQWKADRVRTPAKRGRKPGTGKKNMIKGVTGKVILVTVDLSKFDTGTVFFQNGFCQAYQGISKCLECDAVGAGDFPASRYCRFLEFRKLRIHDKVEGKVCVEGFATFADAKTEDLVPWTPLKAGYSGMDCDTALYVLSKIVRQFITVINEEAKTIPDNDVLPVWKCAVRGVRELCDTCDTTIFNLHWVCRHCGFTICPSCFQLACSSHDGSEAVSSCQTPWPACSINQQLHSPYQLLISQIIPGNVLADVLCGVFQICQTNNIPISNTTAISQLLLLLNRQQVTSPKIQEPILQSLGLEVPLIKTIGESSSSSLLELPHSCSNGTDEELLLPPPVEAPHLWLCDGDILCLLDPTHVANVAAFQWSWRHRRPVLVADVNKHIDSNLWTPQAFKRDFGEELADLIDCRTGLIMPQVPCKAFWNGFEDIQARLKDPIHNAARLLKLKDWPTGEDFCDKLPDRFSDLMDALPLPEYTRRDGKYNLVASLPDFFVKPDLGPKMYNAYGTTTLPQCGTTNLHLDVSDAVNVMMYATFSETREENERDLLRVVRKECCNHTLQRIISKGTKIGALWHIYSPLDTGKIRTFLTKILEEQGMTSLYPGSDPIHDQLIYMDSVLRERLWEEEGVRGWAIAQCIGDSIFIPAGAPHQVQNYCSCIKVAEDFVSPEHIDECLKLTEEFRQLSDRHANHEDKLQIKNILYHSVKDIVGTLKLK